MNNQQDILQIIGSLMKTPSLLSQTDKYNLEIEDFPTRFYRYIFDAINGLYANGANNIQVIDIENYLNVNSSARKTYEENKGREFLNDAIELSDSNNFIYYYNRLKKCNALKKLKKAGFNTDKYYCDDLLDPEANEINKNFEELTIDEIFNDVKKKIASIEQNFLKNEVTETHSAFYNINNIIDSVKTGADIGLPLQGQLTTLVTSGARIGTFMIRSGSSGLGKSRTMVADACFLAYPFRFNSLTGNWEQKGSSEKVLYIATEQNIQEIQRMILAYLTDINESKFRYGLFTELEQKVINQALKIMEEYKDNFYITQMPNPTNELIKTTISNQCLMYGINYVFFDYIFICPSLIKEFKGTNLRNDKLFVVYIAFPFISGVSN